MYTFFFFFGTYIIYKITPTTQLFSTYIILVVIYRYLNLLLLQLTMFYISSKGNFYNNYVVPARYINILMK